MIMTTSSGIEKNVEAQCEESVTHRGRFPTVHWNEVCCQLSSFLPIHLSFVYSQELRLWRSGELFDCFPALEPPIERRIFHQDLGQGAAETQIALYLSRIHEGNNHMGEYILKNLHFLLHLDDDPRTD